MKKIFLIALVFVIGACAPPNTSEQPMLTSTSQPNLALPSNIATKTSISSPQKTSIGSPATATTSIIAEAQTITPTRSTLRCLQLISPANGMVLKTVGNVDFSWQSQPGAQFYILTIEYPNGPPENIKTFSTKLSPTVKSTAAASTYRWNVMAYNSKGKLICSSTDFTFSKSQTAKNSGTAIVPPPPAAATAPTDIVPPAPQPSPPPSP